MIASFAFEKAPGFARAVVCVVFVGGEAGRRRGVGKQYAVIVGEDHCVGPYLLAHGLVPLSEASNNGANELD